MKSENTHNCGGGILYSRGLFHKTFFYVIYCHFAVNYGNLVIYEQVYGQNLAITTHP